VVPLQGRTVERHIELNVGNFVLMMIGGVVGVIVYVCATNILASKNVPGAATAANLITLKEAA
jgi:hypothetical protein